MTLIPSLNTNIKEPLMAASDAAGPPKILGGKQKREPNVHSGPCWKRNGLELAESASLQATLNGVRLRLDFHLLGILESIAGAEEKSLSPQECLP